MAEGTRPLSASIAEGFSGLGRRIGDALSYITPDVYEKGDYAPQQWEKWYADTQPGGVHYERHQEFLRRLEPVLDRRYREYKDALKSGAWRPEAMPEIAKTGRSNKEVSDKVKDIIRGKPVGNDPEARAYASLFLDYMRDNSLGGRSARNSVTPEQYAEWQTFKPGGEGIAQAANAPYRLNNAGKDNLERTIDYNLMTTFQTDPVHRPAFLKSGLLMGNLQNLVGMAYPSGIGMAAQQLGNVWGGDPVSAVDNAVMWDDYSRQKFAENPYYWNDRLAGATIPQASALTAEGLEEKTQGGGSMMGTATRYLSGPMLFPNLSEKERQTLIDFQRQYSRYTPIIPKPDDYDYTGQLFADEEETQRLDLARQLNAQEAEAWQGFSTVLPEQIKQFNKATGLNIKPTYGSAAMNDLAMVVPGILGDPQNVAQTALAAATGGMSGLVRALLSTAAETPGEGGFNTAISIGNTPQPLNEYLFSSNPGVPLRTPDGRTPAPDSREYDEALNRYRLDQKNVLGQAAQFLQDDRQKTQKRQKASSFIESKPY